MSIALRHSRIVTVVTFVVCGKIQEGNRKTQHSRMKAQLISALLAVLVSSTVADTYVAPGLQDSLASSSQSYLIGISTFVLFIVCIVMAVGALMGIDYSEDSLLVVDVEPSAGHDE